jgi:hypothetical protein
VSTGATAQHDVTVPALGQLTVTVPPSTPGSPTLTAYDAVTGDIVATSAYSARLPAVPVLLRFDNGPRGACWYVGESAPTAGGRRPAVPVAQSITVTPTGPVTLALTPGVNCRADAVAAIDTAHPPTKPRTWGAGAPA